VTEGVADTFLHLRKSYVRRSFMPVRCDNDRFAKCAITYVHECFMINLLLLTGQFLR